MDKSILDQYTSLKAEISDVEVKIAKLTAGIRKLEASEVADSVSCGKRGKKPLGTVKIHGVPIREITIRKQRLQRRRLEYSMLLRKLEDMTAEVESYINTLPDSEIRRLLRFRFLQGMEWRQVSRMMGRGYSVSACKMKVARFLKCDVCDAKM